MPFDDEAPNENQGPLPVIRNHHQHIHKLLISPDDFFGRSSDIKVTRSTMYEPVLDRCVTTTTIEPGCFSSNDRGEPPEKPPRRHSRPPRRGPSRPTSHEDPIPSKMRSDEPGAAAAAVRGCTVDSCTQTAHPAPYRLRLLPSAGCPLQAGPSQGGCALRLGCCCSLLGRWLLSQVGLALVVVGWALLGALAFFGTEGPRELEQSQKLADIRETLSEQLAEELQQQQQQPLGGAEREARRALIGAYLRRHERLFQGTVGEGGSGGGGTVWTYPGCVLFAVSLLTTLGFGAPVPRTALGRTAAILFAAVGVPLHFLLVLNVGHLGASRLRLLASRAGPSPGHVSAESKPAWLGCFPFLSVVSFYVLGVVLFGVARGRPAVDCLMFPLDFTAAGGVADVGGCTRVLYALYLEAAVSLAAVVVSLLQASAGRGVVDVGLKWGLLTNS